ncbi:MAG TPA: hypothetical protein VGN81_31705 [Pseudonocardiaceae bacterium]|jgi:hypothetical protein
MMVVAVVIGFGLALGAFGLVDPDMYVIGLVVVLIGAIGFVVRLADRLRGAGR